MRTAYRGHMLLLLGAHQIEHLLLLLAMIHESARGRDRHLLGGWGAHQHLRSSAAAAAALLRRCRRWRRLYGGRAHIVVMVLRAVCDGGTRRESYTCDVN